MNEARHCRYVRTVRADHPLRYNPLRRKSSRWLGDKLLILILPEQPFLAPSRLLTISSGQAGVAQLVEQLIRNQQVIGSSPIAGSKIIRKIAFPADGPSVEYLR